MASLSSVGSMIPRAHPRLHVVGFLSSCLLVLLLVGAATAAPSKASAAQSAPHDWLVEANALRLSNGLPLMVTKTSGPLADATARAAEEEWPDDSMFDPPFDSDDPVEFCETCSDGAPRYYADAGGTRPVGFAELGQQNSLVDGLQLSPTAAALLLDPRAEAVSFANTVDSEVTLFGVELAEGRAITAPTLVGQKLVVPARPLVVLLVPAGLVPRATLRDSRGAIASFSPDDFVAGIGGLRALGLAKGYFVRRAFAYGHTYSVKASGATLHFKTKPLPRSFLARTWRFKGMKASDRSRFLLAIKAAPPLFRKIMSVLDGGITVIRGTCLGAAGCAQVGAGDGTRNGVAIGSFSNRYLIYHELAHEIDFLAIDDLAWNKLFAAFRRSPMWRKCIPIRYYGVKQCLGKMEIFAEQVGYWALGLGPKSRSSTFDDHPLLKPRAFSQLLGRLWGFGPEWTGDPAAFCK